MLRQQLRRQRNQLRLALRLIWHDWSLQIVLWLVWTLAVAATAYFNWHSDAVAHLPIDSLRIVIRCAETGVFGLIIMTLIEMRFEPWRFYQP